MMQKRNVAGAESFLQEIQKSKLDLPCSPDLLEKLSDIVYEGSLTTVEEVGALIDHDQSFSAKALALANSAFYGFQGRVTSIGRAVSVLGLRELRNMVFLMLYKRLSARIDARFFDFPSYLIHNYQVAVLAKELSMMAGHGDPEEVFTAGLLHDIGKILTAIYRAEDWKRIIAKDDTAPVWKAEQEYWGMDHGTVAEVALKSWNMPPVLSEPVGCHHRPKSASRHHEEALLIQLADCFAHRFDPGNGESQGDVPDTRGVISGDPEEVAQKLQYAYSRSLHKALLLT
ncbi:MAG: HDOD domain-containing protein [Desulfovibrionales bacterium]